MRLFNTFNITLGTCLRFLGYGALIAIILAYVQFQARNILLGPTISLQESPTLIQHDRTITLHGSARNIVKLTLNGKEIHTDEKGEFTQAVVLENGYTVMTLNAQDRFGRDTVLTREYVYVPQS